MTLDLLWDEGDDVVVNFSNGTMYGVRGWDDSPCYSDYDPWRHAEMLGIDIVHRDLPDPRMVAAYSEAHGAIFLRTTLHSISERCGLAHEIVHAEHADVGYNEAQEERADRIAARRLIRPWRISHLYSNSESPGDIALELGVTDHIMETWQRAMQAGFYGHRF